MKKTGLLFLFIGILFASCSDHITPDFVFSPEMPKCGQTVTFTNLTTGDADWTAKSWNWDFGDNGTSISKSPTKIYRKPGVYTISLMVDSSKRLVKERDIIVYDSIPTIVHSTDSIYYYQNTTISALIYNPYGYDITYKWTFSENAVGSDITNKEATTATVPLYFNKRDVNEIVKLTVTVGDSTYTVRDTFYVHNYKTKSLVMAQKNGSILRQRMFKNGIENYEQLPINSGNHPFNISIEGNDLYIFNAGSDVSGTMSLLNNGDGAIRRVNMSNNTSTEIINNTNNFSRNGFFNGFVNKTNVYWTDYNNIVYRTSKDASLGQFEWKGSEDGQGTLPYYLVRAQRLGYYGKGLEGQPNGGIYFFDNAYFWAKGVTGRGIYRFTAADILTSNATSSTAAPAMGAILKDFAIRAFTIDELNAKIYFSVTAPAEKTGLWVSGINGENAKQIEKVPVDASNLFITGIAVDNESNRVYWAYRSPESVGASAPAFGSWTEYYNNNPTHKSGVKMTPLVTNDLNIPSGTITYFLRDIEVFGLTIDKTRR